MQISKKKLAIVIGIAALIALAGCNDRQTNTDDIASDADVNASGVSPGQSYAFEVAVTEKNQRQLVRAQPPFVMDSSLERANLIRRYEYLNDRNNVHHVYMLSNDGKVVSYMVAQGKVSSVNSKLTNNKQIVASDECVNRGHQGSGTSCYMTVESPQMDGSYGTNGNAIFFFTTDGQYVEYNGKYLVSEEPKNIQTQVSLVANASAKSTTVNDSQKGAGFNTSSGANVSVEANTTNSTGNTTNESA